MERVSKVLENRVSEVRATARLTDSAACLVVGDFDMGSQMRRIMEAAGQEMPESKTDTGNQSCASAGGNARSRT